MLSRRSGLVKTKGEVLIDECLHTTLVEVARELGHEAQHVNWLGLSGATDWA